MINDDGPATIEELAARCRATGATGRELADSACAAVASAFPTYSLLRLWETPRQALRRHRGWSHQYNTILLLLLRQLGFRARLVHAARVRGFRHPWWLNGHTWVKVEISGHELNACASSPGNRVGAVGFTPLTRELPMRRVTRWALGLAMAPFVVGEMARAWFLKRPVPPWIHGRRNG
ncbi:MAG: hypothetical protein Q4G35_11175 [Propionibacteriaceae bacterium]|nr:hypothetical protein [Propionibacteriaceae bacterium]